MSNFTSGYNEINYKDQTSSDRNNIYLTQSPEDLKLMKGPYDDLDDKILITELAHKPPRGSALYNIETPKQTSKRL